MKLNKKIILSGFFILISAGKSFAATNNLQMFNTLSFTEGEAFKNNNHKQILNTFIEYPLSNKMSVGSTLQGSHIDSRHNDGTEAYALNSVELFHRYKIFSREKLGITMHNAYKFPGVYNQDKYLGLMPQQADYEFRLLFAYNMKDRLVNTVVRGDTPYFARFETAYRRRFGNPFDEARFTFWGGYNLNSKFALLIQDNIIWNIQSKTNSTSNSYSSFRTSKDANNIATFSLIYRFDKDMALQFGYLRRLHGNAPFYDDHGVTIGLWNSF
jgi:hypothetical protein